MKKIAPGWFYYVEYLYDKYMYLLIHITTYKKFWGGEGLQYEIEKHILADGYSDDKCIEIAQEKNFYTMGYGDREYMETKFGKIYTRTIHEYDLQYPHNLPRSPYQKLIDYFKEKEKRIQEQGAPDYIESLRKIRILVREGIHSQTLRQERDRETEEIRTKYHLYLKLASSCVRDDKFMRKFYDMQNNKISGLDFERELHKMEDMCVSTEVIPHQLLHQDCRMLKFHSRRLQKRDFSLLR